MVTRCRLRAVPAQPLVEQVADRPQEVPRDSMGIIGIYWTAYDLLEKSLQEIRAAPSRVQW